MTPVSGYLGAIAANGPVSLMVPSVITTAPAWITPDAPRRGSVSTYAPRMMMVSVIALHTLAISSPAVASPDELLRRGLIYTRCCGKNRQEQYADHGPCERGRGPLSPPASHAYQDRDPPPSSGESCANLTSSPALASWRRSRPEGPTAAT